MKLMSEEGVSSIAVLDGETSALLSAVSVTDIGKVCIQTLLYGLYSGTTDRRSLRE